MTPESAAFFNRIKSSLVKTKDLSVLANWLTEYTRDPKDPSKPWSFNGHEMQIDICNETRLKCCVKKCSQVGLSELTVRILLALLDIYSGSTAIYTLPTANYARKFAKSRIDPVIENSEYLNSRVPTGNDSSELKRIGNSFLYIVGTSGSTSPISIPADILVRDEVDFSNQVLLSMFHSRLGHAEDGGIVRDFSTPTLPGFGIAKSFDDSTQAYRQVKCDSCGTWQELDFFRDVVIPGFDADVLVEFEKHDLKNPAIRIDEAYLSCPGCGNPLSQANLADPDKRKWVHRYPDREVAGYYVMPLDVPSVNTVPDTLKTIDEYERKADWVNFRIGAEFEDAESAFLTEIVKDRFQVEPVRPRPMAATGCVYGIDVGKTSWIMVGKRNGIYLDIIHMERVRQNNEDALYKRVYELHRWYGAVMGVMDAAPDFSTVMKLQGKLPAGSFFGAYYTRTQANGMSLFSLNETEGTVNINKLRSMDYTLKQVNSGRVRFCRSTEKQTVLEHMANSKRTVRQNSTGEQVAVWVRTGDDHFVQALNYLVVADQMCDYNIQGLVPALPLPAKARIGGQQETQNRTRLLG